MTNLLKKAIERTYDLNLWPVEFVQGSAAISVKNRLNIDSILLAFLTGTSIFVGKSKIKVGPSDREEVGSLWVLNVQVS